MRRDSGMWSHPIDTTLRWCEDRLWAAVGAHHVVDGVRGRTLEVKELVELRQIEEPSRRTPCPPRARRSLCRVGGGQRGCGHHARRTPRLLRRSYHPGHDRHQVLPRSLGIAPPQKVENLLVAGRCVAGDKVSHAATRQMMCCTVTGQGAGVAAAVSVKEGLTPRQVDISKVQTALKKQGVRIE